MGGSKAERGMEIISSIGHWEKEAKGKKRGARGVWVNEAGGGKGQ